MVRPFQLLWLGLLTVIAAPAAAPGAGSRTTPDAHAQHDGVTLDAYSRNGQITFCLDAENDIKIASEYGVEFTVPQGEAKLWNEKLPKVVAGSQPYFDLPVRIDLKTRGVSHERQVSIGLGVCVSTKYCTPVTFQVIIPTKAAAGETAVCAK
jgi:hypothetical protein